MHSGKYHHPANRTPFQDIYYLLTKHSRDLQSENVWIISFPRLGIRQCISLPLWKVRQCISCPLLGIRQCTFSIFWKLNNVFFFLINHDRLHQLTDESIRQSINSWITKALISGFGAVGWICALIIIFNYITACMLMLILRKADPFHFGSLSRAMFNVLRVRAVLTLPITSSGVSQVNGTDQSDNATTNFMIKQTNDWTTERTNEWTNAWTYHRMNHERLNG